MKKILFIIPYVPYPLNSGGNQAFFNMVDYIRRQMSVSLLLYPDSDRNETNLEQLKKVWPDVDFYVFTRDMAKPAVRHPFYYKWLGKAKASLTRKMRRQLLASETQDLVRKKSTLWKSMPGLLDSAYMDYVVEVAGRGFDIIQVEFYELIELGYLLPRDVPTVFVHHEIRFIRNQNEMALFEDVTPQERMLYEMAKDFECMALKQFGHIVTLTDTDARILSDLTGCSERIRTSPAIVRMPERKDMKDFLPATDRLTFVGSEDHFPNLDAVDWFCREVIPCLRRRGLKFKVQVVGQWRGDRIKELCTACPELELPGFVEDLHEYLRGSVFLVPIRIGSGMRMKILDGIASRAPIVTTTKGCEGLDFVSGTECLVADEAEGFAEAIVRLLGDVPMQERLAVQAEEKLARIYDPVRMLDRRMAVYKEILS